MNRDQQVTEIVQFVGRHQESQATRSICRRLVADYDGRVDGGTLISLQHSLHQADDQDIAACYDLVR